MTVKTRYNFEEVYSTFEPMINRYLTRLIGTDEAAELTQDVFIKVNNNIGLFNEDSKLSTWIYKIATNAAIDKMRSRSYREKKNAVSDITEYTLDNNSLNLDKDRFSLEEQVIRQEMGNCIQGYIAALPHNYRMVLLLSEVEGLKNNQIATILDISIETVKIRCHRAKKKLRQLLSDNCLFLSDYIQRVSL